MPWNQYYPAYLTMEALMPLRPYERCLRCSLLISVRTIESSWLARNTLRLNKRMERILVHSTLDSRAVSSTSTKLKRIKLMTYLISLTTPYTVRLTMADLTKVYLHWSRDVASRRRSSMEGPSAKVTVLQNRPRGKSNLHPHLMWRCLVRQTTKELKRNTVNHFPRNGAVESSA